VRAVADAKQTGPAPASQTIDLHGQQFDFRPIVEFRHAIFEEGRDGSDLRIERRKRGLSDLLVAALGNDVSNLEIVSAIEQDKKLAAPEKTECLWRVVRAFLESPSARN